MKRLIFALLGNLFSVIVFAQTGVTIKVVDAKTGEPLPNVSVKIKSTGKGGNTIHPGSIKSRLLQILLLKLAVSAIQQPALP